MPGYRIRYRLSRFALQCAFLVSSAGYIEQLQAQEVRVDIDPAKTSVTFTLDATMHTVHGTFKLKSGNLKFDSASGAASGLFVLDATTAETGNSGRDRKMHKNVLQSTQFPEIAFVPRRVVGKVELSGSSKVDVEGTMRIHGAEHPMTLTFALQTKDSDVTAISNFPVPYQAWGMKNPSNFFLHVSDKVQLTINAVGRISR